MSGKGGKDERGAKTGRGDRRAWLDWAERLKAQGWGCYRAGYTHGRDLWDHARAAFEQAEALCREAGGPEGREGLIGALSGRGAVLRSSADPDAIRRAIDLYREEIALLRELGREKDVPAALVNVGLAYRDLVTVAATPVAADIEEGVRACREALEGAKRRNLPEAQALAAGAIADICVLMARIDADDYRQRHLKEALSFYGQAEKLWEGKDEDGQVLCRVGMAQAYIDLGQNLEGARDFLEEALRFYRDYAGTPVKGPVLYQMAQINELQAQLLEAEGKPEEAAAARREGLERFEALGLRPH